MEIDTILQAVSTVGFPIVVCWYMLLQNDKMRSVIESNTLVIAELKLLVKELKNDLEKGDKTYGG